MAKLNKLLNQERIDTIVDIGKRGLSYVPTILGVALYCRYTMGSIKPVKRTITSSCASYDDAIEAIMDSSMPSSYKTDAIAAVRRREWSDYYKSVISIVDSSMCSSNKVEAIKKLEAR